MQKQGMNPVLTDDLEISASFPSNQEKQAVQTQQGDSQNPTSALLPALPNGSSASRHVTQQVVDPAAYGRRKDKTAADTHRRAGDSVMSPLTSHVINPTLHIRCIIFNNFLQGSAR